MVGAPAYLGSLEGYRAEEILNVILSRLAGGKCERFVVPTAVILADPSRCFHMSSASLCHEGKPLDESKENSTLSGSAITQTKP